MAHMELRGTALFTSHSCSTIVSTKPPLYQEGWAQGKHPDLGHSLWRPTLPRDPQGPCVELRSHLFKVILSQVLGGMHNLGP